jgi:hypothetical protein
VPGSVHVASPPLRGAALDPIAHDVYLPDDRRATLDHLYAGVDNAVLAYLTTSDSTSLHDFHAHSICLVPNVYLRHVSPP